MNQNDAEWHRWRTDGIGGSDIPAILNMSKFSSRSKVFMEKVKRISDNKESFITKIGHQIEEKMRDFILFNLGVMDYGIDKIESPCVVHPKYSWARVSLDGLLPKAEGQIERIWEHKLVGKKRFEDASGNIIGDDHFAQVQYQMFVTGINDAWLHYTLFEKKETNYENFKIFNISKDEKTIDMIFKECRKFWNEVLEKRKELGIS